MARPSHDPSSMKSILAGAASGCRMAVRILRRQWRFTTLAILVLAVGIGASTGLFSLVNALAFRGLPVPESDRLVLLYRVYPNGNHGPMLIDQIEILAERGNSLASLAAYAPISSTVTTDAGVHVARGEVVDGRYFSLLGVSASVGRVLQPSDVHQNAPPVVVVSDRFWRQRLASRPDVIGHVISLGESTESEQYTIAGVLNPRFQGVSDPLSPSEFWIPHRGTRNWMAVIARLNAGASQEAFVAFIDGATPVLRELVRTGAFPRLAQVNLAYEARNLRFSVFKADTVQMPSDPRATLVPARVLWGLGAAVALVLLIATMNVSGLLVARGVLRAPEIATRRALGAGTGQLVGQLLAEAFVITIPAGVLGLLGGAALASLVESLSAIPFGRPVVVDWRVVGFCLLMCGGAAITIALAPIAQTLRAETLSNFRGGRGGTAPIKWLTWIVIPQVGLAFVLLLVAGVHVRTLARIEAGALGHSLSGIDVIPVTSQVPQGTSEESQRVQAQQTVVRTLEDQARTTSGVRAAGIVDRLPFRGYRSGSQAELRVSDGPQFSVPVVRASGRYFGTMGVPVVAGRTFDAHDDAPEAKTVIISVGLASALRPGQPAVGLIVYIAANGSLDPPAPHEVVGVVGDVHGALDVATSAQPVMYLPITRGAPPRTLNVVVQRAASDTQLGQRVRTALREGAAVRVASVRSIESFVDELLYPRRFAAAALVGAGWLGLVLAAIGLFGQVSFSVARRRREIGVRAALGASPGDLRWLVVKEGSRATAMGMLLGAPFAALGLVLSSRLVPGLPLVDGPTLVAVPIALGAVVLMACYVPGRRAAAVDPVSVLRED